MLEKVHDPKWNLKRWVLSFLLKVVCDWVSLSERGRSFHSRGPQTLKALSPAARHRWVDGSDKSIPSVTDEELSELHSEWLVPVYMMGTRHCAWLNGQWRGLWKWYATWLAANAGLSVQGWCGCISSISLLAWQHCSVQAVVSSEDSL